MNVLILSDLHLGRGRYLENGDINILEDFHEDERFCELLDYYSSGKFYLGSVHLVLNGDILNLIHADEDGVFSHIITEERTIKNLKSIIDGHEEFFDALKKFIKRPNKKITYVIGNHDANMMWEGVQNFFSERVGEKVHFCLAYEENGLHIEHGHRFEAINTVPRKKYFLKGPNGQEILNLPWASLFCILILSRLKKDRPNIDKIRPLSGYIRWTFFHDFKFFCKMSYLVLSYFLKTNFNSYIKSNQNFKTNMSLLKQIVIYPKFAKQARRILKRNHAINTVILGHTHIKEWRRYPEDKYYFNTGTWNPIPSMNEGLFDNDFHLTYLLIKLAGPKGNLRRETVAMHSWQGNWRPYREHYSLLD